MVKMRTSAIPAFLSPLPVFKSCFLSSAVSPSFCFHTRWANQSFENRTCILQMHRVSASFMHDPSRDSYINSDKSDITPSSVSLREAPALLVSGAEARSILSLRPKTSSANSIDLQKSVCVQVDLGQSLASARVSVACVKLFNLHSATSNSPVIISWDVLSRLVSHARDGAYALYSNEGDNEGKVFSAERMSDHADGAASSLHVVSSSPHPLPPVLVLGGFSMHRFARDVDPLQDALNKVNALNPYGNVLDTCTGLGYTVLAMLRLEDDDAINSIVTIERNEGVRNLMSMNPWSRTLYADNRVRRVSGDVREILKRLTPNSFDAILHDPPAHAMAGELYSSEMYNLLRRVCKPNARMFHYVGNPASKESGRLYNGIMKRLEEAGFCNIRVEKSAFGIVATADGEQDGDNGILGQAKKLYGNSRRRQRARAQRFSYSKPRRIRTRTRDHG